MNIVAQYTSRWANPLIVLSFSQLYVIDHFTMTFAIY